MKKKHLKDMKKWRAQQAEQKEAEKAKKWFGLWKNKTLKPSKEPVSTVSYPRSSDRSELSNPCQRPASPYPAENPRRMSLSNAFRRMSSMSVKKE